MLDAAAGQTVNARNSCHMKSRSERSIDRRIVKLASSLKQGLLLKLEMKANESKSTWKLYMVVNAAAGQTDNV